MRWIISHRHADTSNSFIKREQGRDRQGTVAPQITLELSVVLMHQLFGSYVKGQKQNNCYSSNSHNCLGNRVYKQRSKEVSKTWGKRGDERILLDVWNPQGKKLLMKENKPCKIDHWFVVWGKIANEQCSFLTGLTMKAATISLFLTLPRITTHQTQANMFGFGTLWWDLLPLPMSSGNQLELLWVVLPGAEIPVWLLCCSPGTSAHSPYLIQH